MAWIQERRLKNGTYRYRAVVRVKGRESVSETFSNKTKAKAWAERIKAEIEDGRYFKTAEAKKHTLKELIERYSKDYEDKIITAVQGSQIRWWKEKIGHLLLSDLTPAKISEYRDLLARETTVRKKQRSNGSVRRHLAILSHMLSTAMKEYEWIEENPMSKVKKPQEPRGRVRWLNDDERKNLLSACQGSSNRYLYPVVVLSISTGMRQGEIMNLTWPDVELQKGKIILYKTKNGEKRVVPLKGLALELLIGLDKVRPINSKLLFPSKNNLQKPIDLRAAWESALKISGVQHLNRHDLRHTAASYLVMNGASAAEIAEVLGHKTLQMVKRYAHLGESHMAGVVEKMNEKIFGV